MKCLIPFQKPGKKTLSVSSFNYLKAVQPVVSDKADRSFTENGSEPAAYHVNGMGAGPSNVKGNLMTP
jgi:hypothetical protein